MYKKYLGAFIGIVVIAALAFVFMNGAGIGGSLLKETADTEYFSGSFAELAERGGAWRCIFTHETETVTLRGTVYVYGENIRGDFESDTQGITVDSHMITDHGFIYTWSPIAPTGYKVPYSLEAGTGNGSSEFRQPYDFRCTPWTVEETKFAIPADTTFVEIASGSADADPVGSYTNASPDDIFVDGLSEDNNGISSPLVITGKARGPWYFEASFPILITDWDGRIIATTPAEAVLDPNDPESTWMTVDFVPFQAVIEFETPAGPGSAVNRGTLILKRDNPSGLPENDAALEIPVVFN